MSQLRERLSEIALECDRERIEHEREQQALAEQRRALLAHNADQVERCIDREVAPRLEDLRAVLQARGVNGSVERLSAMHPASGRHRVRGVRLSVRGGCSFEVRGHFETQAMGMETRTPKGTAERRNAFSAARWSAEALEAALERFLRDFLSGVATDGEPST